MSEHSKTLLRKGALKTRGGAAIPRHALQRKSGTSGEEESALLDAPPREAAKSPQSAASRGD